LSLRISKLHWKLGTLSSFGNPAMTVKIIKIKPHLTGDEAQDKSIFAFNLGGKSGTIVWVEVHAKMLILPGKDNALGSCWSGQSW
jgi:hypothetical protein